jgi:hypothetical protein
MEHIMVQKLEQHEREIDIFPPKPSISHQLPLQYWGGKYHYERY